MTNKRSGLGRGLDALIPSTNAFSGAQEVDIDLIAPNPQQPRSVFDPSSLRELAESIREHGVIQPLIVSHAEAGSGSYQLIAGERRLLASRLAGLRRVPVIIKEASPQALLELALVENLQRADLGPLEEATAFKRLAEEFGLTQEAVATRVGRSRPSVANSLRLLGLPPEIQASLARNEISAGHARALLAIDDRARQLQAWQRILRDSLTVRQVEALIKARASQPATKAPPTRASPELQAVQQQLQSSLGTRVDLKKGRKGGQVVIHFYSDEELDALLERLG